MIRAEFRWGLSLACAVIVWVMTGVAAVMVSLLPEPWRWIPVALPVGAVLLIGVVVARHWWTRGAWLIAAPLLGFGVYSLVETLRSADDARYHSYAVMFTIIGLGYGLALAVVATALAGLGVVIGQRRQVRNAAALVDDAWSLGEGGEQPTPPTGDREPGLVARVDRGRWHTG